MMIDVGERTLVMIRQDGDYRLIAPSIAALNAGLPISI